MTSAPDGQTNPSIDMLRIPRGYAPCAETLYQGDAITEFIIRVQIDIAGDDRTQIVAKRDPDRWTVIERADALLQDVARATRCLFRQPARQVGRYLPFGKNAGALRRKTKKIRGPLLVDKQESAKYGRHQDCAPRVRFGDAVERAWIGLATSPFAILAFSSQCIPQRTAAPGGAQAELLCKLTEQALAVVEVTARPPDLVTQDAGIGEVLKHRHDVSERFMEHVDVGIAGFVETRMDAIEQRVRRFVCDDDFHSFAAQAAPAIQTGLTQGDLYHAAAAVADAAGKSAQQQQPSDSDHDQHPADGCAICAVIALATNLLFATPPVLQLPQAIELLYLTTEAEFAHLKSARHAFQSRAPPLS